ncbi:hypothetical protein ADK38_47380, partial [Streptomyces varsoviensis]
ALPVPQIGFNYLGRFGTGPVAEGDVEAWQLAGDTAMAGAVAPEMAAGHTLEANAVVQDGPAGPVVTLTLGWPSGALDESEAERLGRGWLEMLGGLAAHTTTPGAGGHTPSDFPLLALDQESVAELESAVPG